MSGHGLAWFAVNWRQMWGRKQPMGGVIWVNLTWGETSKYKHRGPLRASRDRYVLAAIVSWLLNMAAPSDNNITAHQKNPTQIIP